MDHVKNTKPMDFSLFYFAAEEGGKSAGPKYNLLLEGSKFADRHDLSGIWIPERHFHSLGGRFPNPAVAAAAVAVCTNKIKIRSGSVVLPLHDPVCVAEEWAMVDHLSSGRVELGIASGWWPNDFVFRPDNFTERHKHMLESMQTLQHLWQGGSLVRKNGAGDDHSFSIFPRPVQRKLPVWISAAGSEETFRHAGSIGAKVVTNMVFQTMDKMKSNIATYYKALADNGYDPSDGKVAIMIHTFMGRDSDFVQRTVKAPLIEYLSHFTNLLAPTQSTIDMARSHEFLVEMAFQRFFARGGLFGTPESCLERINALKSVGISEVACLIDFGIDDDLVLAHLEYILALRRLVQLSEREPQVSAHPAALA